MILAPGQLTVMDYRDPQLQGMSPMARFVRSGFNVNALRTHALLPRDVWLALDRRVVEVSGTILNGIADIVAFGLDFNNGGIGTMISSYQQASAMRAAAVTMDPSIDAERDRRVYTPVYVPVPFFLVPFQINAREVAAGTQNGFALDMSHIDDAVRSVSEGMETVLFSGSSLVIQGTSIYGYLNHPNRNTTSGADWGTATNILPNVLTMLGIMKGDGALFTGPYRLYLHPDQFQQTLALNANTSMPILRTIEQLPGFGPGSVKECGFVTAGQGVLVNMTSNVVDLSVGQATTVVEWEEKGGLVSNYVVMACLVPRVKSTAAGQSGIVHISSI